MAYNPDGRGSHDQRTLFDYLKEIYPKLEICYEYPLYEVNQRMDLFVPALGLCIEYDGNFHNEFNSFFHKDFEDYKKTRFMDQKKLEYLTGKGVKVVRIKHNKMVKSSQELKAIIDSVPYPDFEYSGIEDVNPVKKERLERDRTYRKELYRKYKEKK